MSTKHTPGRNRNWTASTGNGGYGFYDGATVSDNRGLVVAVALGDAPELDALATARLIAAAPDLLEAAIEFVRKVDAGEARSTKSYAAFKAAIAKATGEVA
jgi:hypothetical protein